MADILQLNTNYVAVGLHDQTYTVPTGGAGVYRAHVDCTEIPPSGLSILVKQNGSTVYTAATLTPTQSAIQFSYSQPYSDADVIHIVLSSSNANDNLLNSVKTNMSISQGA